MTAEGVVHVRAEWDNAVMARPGDTLVVGLSGHEYEADQVKYVKAEIEEQLPGVRIMVILGCEALAVYRERHVLGADQELNPVKGGPLPDWERDLIMRQAQEQEPEGT